MNILYISNHLNIGGITSYLLNLATGIKKRGHNVYIASSGGSMLPKFIEAGIVYLPIPIGTKQELSPGILISLLKLSGIINKNGIELVHTNSRTTQVLGVLLHRFCSIRHVSTCHGFFKKRIFRKLFPCWGEKTIAISESVREHLIRDFRVEEKNIAVIHTGIDTEKFTVHSSQFTAEMKKKLGLGQGPVVGIVARLSEEKGHVYLIEAMRSVLEKIPSAQLLIVGDGKEKQALMNLTKTLKLENNVFFRPAAADTRDVLTAMDIFVLPSLKEGLGIALMEAMVQGIAVIGSEVGGIKTLIKQGFNGLLVNPADTKVLSRAISELLADAGKRQALGNNARDFISKNFSAESMVFNTERVYLECLDAKS
jgi:glycosyltransferase involved in cell wall biosynthesis